MGQKIRDALARVANILSITKAKLAVARKRYVFQHKRAVTNHRRGKKAEAKADRLRAKGYLTSAQRQDKRAARSHHRAYVSQQRSQWWIARIKFLKRKIDGLENTLEDKQRELADWTERNGITITGNRVTGGTARQRLRACALASAAACASGRRRNFYSQPGSYTAKRCITGEASGQRSDCSQWFASVYWSCGLRDPSGGGWDDGYTGTLAMVGERISRAQLKPGDAVLYGTYPFFHVEMYVGPGDKTIGHGSAPIDAGVVDLVPGPTEYRTFL